jgi:hypothetical protein
MALVYGRFWWIGRCSSRFWQRCILSVYAG